MFNDEEKVFYVTIDDKEVEMEVLFTFEPAKDYPGYEGKKYVVYFDPNANEDEQVFTVEVGVLKVVIDVKNCRVATNKNAKVFGSDIWGYECSIPWTTDFEKYFKEDNNGSLQTSRKQAES